MDRRFPVWGGLLLLFLLQLSGCQIGAGIGAAAAPEQSAATTTPQPTTPVSLPPPWLVFSRESCASRCVDFRISVWPDGRFSGQRLVTLTGEKPVEQGGQLAAADLQLLRDWQAGIEQRSAGVVLHNGRPECPEIIRDQPLLLLQRLTPVPGWKLLLGSCRGHAQEVEMDALMQDIARLLDRRINPARSSR